LEGAVRFSAQPVSASKTLGGSKMPKFKNGQFVMVRRLGDTMPGEHLARIRGILAESSICPSYIVEWIAVASGRIKTEVYGPWDCAVVIESCIDPLPVRRPCDCPYEARSGCIEPYCPVHPPTIQKFKITDLLEKSRQAEVDWGESKGDEVW
jgi:hypothetical protein